MCADHARAFPAIHICNRAIGSRKKRAVGGLPPSGSTSRARLARSPREKERKAVGQPRRAIIVDRQRGFSRRSTELNGVGFFAMFSIVTHKLPTGQRDPRAKGNCGDTGISSSRTADGTGENERALYHHGWEAEAAGRNRLGRVEGVSSFTCASGFGYRCLF